MGHFFAASAFRASTPEAIGAAVVAYGEKHRVGVSLVLGQSRASETSDALLYAPENDWTVAIWPRYFNIHDVPLCASVSASLGIVAVTVNVYEGAFWSMEVLDSGRLVDLFSPWGDYFAENDEAAAAERIKWLGDPEKAAATLGSTANVLRPYYRYVGDQTPGKASADDQFPLEDFWVFTDIWRRLGVIYPENPDTFVAKVRFGKQFGRALPGWGGESLEIGPV